MSPTALDRLLELQVQGCYAQKYIHCSGTTLNITHAAYISQDADAPRLEFSFENQISAFVESYRH